MASFGWKRKIGEKVSKVTSQNFEKESAGEGGTFKNDDVDWLHSVKRKKGILLEDNVTKSKRLKDEGALLALNGRYWEAVKKWDEGIQLMPEDATFYEMKSQAIRSFQVAFHLYPSNRELWEEDLKWAQQLLQQKREVEGKNLQNNGKDACIDSIPDYDFESDEVVAVCDAISQKQKRANKNKTVVVSSSGTMPCQQSEEDQTTSDDPTSYIKAR
ncbi:tetratricopeptide repeat protein 33 isoform X2 [Lithobates pipiens]